MKGSDDPYKGVESHRLVASKAGDTEWEMTCLLFSEISNQADGVLEQCREEGNRTFSVATQLGFPGIW